MLNLKSVLFVVVALSFTQSAFGQTKKRILIIGDSLTEGYGVAKEASYPSQLQALLQKSKPNFDIQVVNAGSSGSTSASAPNRMKWHLKAKPDVLVLALGGNDGLRGIPVSSTKKNLQKAIELAKQKKVKVFLAGMKLPMNYGQKYRKEFEQVFLDLVKENKIQSIPFLLKGVGGEKSLNLADGIHPNEEGHKKIAETVAKSIEGVL